MTEQLTDHEKAQLAAEDKRARAWVRIQQEEAAKRAYDQRWADLTTMTNSAAFDFISAECAKGDALKRAEEEQAERETRELGARMRQAAIGARIGAARG